MTVVVGTAGHIDHGKTTLLRALTGIDADRLPEERRRGMTIDVGYAHLSLEDGEVVDFVDVPGHDRLVGNMLVGAGEIDAAMLVVAADDGIRAQTLEHLALLDALDVSRGLAVVTKVDTVGADRVADVVAAVVRLLAGTSLAGSPVIAASGVSGAGLDLVRSALMAMARSVIVVPRPPTLAIDRVFSVRGRGTVVTGTLRGGPITAGDRLRAVPGAADDLVRVREIQVHGQARSQVDVGGRTALNVTGAGDALQRGIVLTTDPTVVATDRILAAFRGPIADRARARLHAGTAAVDAVVGRSGRDALTLPDGRAAGTVRLAAPIPLRPGDPFVLRRGTTIAPIGGVVLDTLPPRGVSRRRQTDLRVAALARAGGRLDLHGAVVDDGRVELAPDVRSVMEATALGMVTDAGPDGVRVGPVRASLVVTLRRLVTLRRDEATGAAMAIVDDLVRNGGLDRDGDVVRARGTHVAPRDPRIDAAMDRLEAALAVPAPPSLSEAASGTGCAPDAVRELERVGRIVRLDSDLAYASSTYRDITDTALRLAANAPLTPAVLRDATGTSRKYVLAILEDLDRRAILRRTPAGHVPGPRAATARST